MLKGKQRHCIENVVVLGSETVKSSTNRSSLPRRNCLRNLGKSDIFRTRQKSGQVYESAALTAELRAPETEAYRAYPDHVQGVGHAFEFLYRAAFGILQCQSGCPRERMPWSGYILDGAIRQIEIHSRFMRKCR
jgi:hypothetical protein